MRIDFKNKKLLSQEEASEKDVQFYVEESKLQLQADLLSTRRSLESKKAALEEAKTTYPLDCTNIVELMDEVEGLKKGIKNLEALQKEFGF